MKTNTNLSCLLMIVVVLAHSTMALAGPASPDVSRVVQPDGSVMDLVLKGDEWSNSVETKSGYSVAKGQDGFWYYVSHFEGKTPVLENVRAHEPARGGTVKHVRPARDLPQTTIQTTIGLEPLSAAPIGDFSGKVLFILVEFTDQSRTYPPTYFASLLKTSIKDYYSKASHGKVTLIPAEETHGPDNNGVVGWIELARTHPNNGHTGATRNEQNKLVAKEAIMKADRFVKFESFDTNRDGFVDANELAIVVICAGFEASYDTLGAYSPSVWAHTWDLDTVGVPTLDGVVVGAYHNGAGGYAQVGEIHQSNDTNRHRATMGPMVHELGHLIFGLPDLYDTDGSSSGVGGFCVMGYGSWGMANTDAYSGMTPVMPCAWVRYKRGWATKAVRAWIRAAGGETATSATTVFRRSTNNAKQYFLVENRQPLGYDKGLERWLGADFGGIAIWHIDDSRGDLPYPNNNNANDKRRWVDLEEGDATQMGTGRGEKTDLWYVGSGTVFNNTSISDSRLYGGASDVMITTNTGPCTAMDCTAMHVGFSISPGTTPNGFDEQFTGTTALNWVPQFGNWSIVQNDQSANEYYHSVGVAGMSSIAIYNQKYTNFDYSARLRRIGPTSTEIEGANRLWVRASGPVDSQGWFANGYLFQYRRDGSFSIHKTVNGTRSPILDWTTPDPPLVKPGEEWNTLRVVANGPNLSFYINDIETGPVWTDTDTPFTTGCVGVGFSTATEGSLDVDWATLTVPISSGR